MGTTRPHVPVVLHTTNETADFSGSMGTIHTQDSIDLFLPASTKPIGFFDCPFALEWVNGKAISTKSS